ncbi:MAG TPA: hypothetical protein VFH38_00535 [Jatrophihabitans sp.]|nr:hypothetical protein [Jatrophihabitans sp.]
MRPIHAVALSAAVLVGAGCVATPALASGRPATQPTRLTLHAAKDSVAPKRHDPLIVHLDSRHQGIEGETANLSLWERSVIPGSHKTQWTDVTTDGTVTDDGAGKYVISGVTPNDPHARHGHKDQFQVRFAGDTGYRHSRSSVITIVVRPAQ